MTIIFDKKSFETKSIYFCIQNIKDARLLLYRTVIFLVRFLGHFKEVENKQLIKFQDPMNEATFLILFFKPT